MPILIPPKRRWRLRAGFILLALLSAGGPSPSAQTAIPREYQIKAAFLFNFAQFVKWPPGAFARADQPFCIGILGEDSFGAFLDETVRGEKVEGRPLVVQRYGGAGEIKECQILFIDKSENKRLKKILGALKGRNILTVGDFEGFTKSGGVIRFLPKKNKIRFRINLEAAKRARLSISSKMLRLAEITGPVED